MIVQEAKKLNKFEHYSIPRNRDLFARVGMREIPHTIEGQTADFNSRLVDRISGSFDDYVNQMLRDSQMPSDVDTSTMESSRSEDGTDSE